jgi:esterase/lipase superfamily enzyme
MTWYVSENDQAIGISGWLFSSVERLGQLTADMLTLGQRENLRRGGTGFVVIDCKVSTDFLGHGYWVDNPAVLSDVILVLRDDLDVGAENGRPLIHRDDGFYEINDDYLLKDR